MDIVVMVAHQQLLSGEQTSPCDPLRYANPTGPPQHVTLSGDHHLPLLVPLTYASLGPNKVSLTLVCE